MSSKKMRYRGPQPDDATFKTQKEFIDSLTPIALDSVDENSRTCPYCWRAYGESNPGQDDAEQPVMFKCNHVFGEQCMRSLFALREPIRVDLVPLSFAPGSKGADLGSRLSAYVDSHGVERSALLTGGSREKDFKKLLREALSVEKQDNGNHHIHGLELLGNDWYAIVFELSLNTTQQPLKIHLLENGVILDTDHTVRDPYTLSYEEMDFLSSYGHIGMPMPPIPPMLSMSPFYTVQPVPNTPANQDHGLSGAGAPGTGLSASPTAPSALIFAPPADMFAGKMPPPYPYTSTEPTWDQEEKKLEEDKTKLSSTQGTWKDVLSSKSKLDSLVEKHKELELKSAQKEEDFAKKKMEAKKGPANPGMVATPVQSPKPGANAAPLTQLQKQEIQQKAAEEELKRRREALAKDKARKDRSKAVFIDKLAQSFVGVYEAYERYQYDDALAAGRPPPVKKLKLADQTIAATPPTTHDQPQNTYLARAETIELMALVHQGSLSAKGLEVNPPYLYNYLDTEGTDEDGDEDEDMDDEEDGAVDAERLNKIIAGKTIVLRRKVCISCNPKSTQLVSFQNTPEYVFWKDNKKIPDDCPKCRRVLFEKEPSVAVCRQ